VVSIKTPEPTRRANRDHPQDARGGGAIPLRVERVVINRDDESQFSQEIPVVIPEDEEMFEEIESDTPDSLPADSPHAELESADPEPPPELARGSSARKSRRPPDSDAHDLLSD